MKSRWQKPAPGRGLERRRYVVTGLLILAVVALATGMLAGQRPAVARSGGPYDLGWNTLDSGGTFSSGGPYVLGGTMGQADAGVLTGGSYTLRGGFWKGGAQRGTFRVYLPLVVRASR
jgi:hypothetical protein